MHTYRDIFSNYIMSDIEELRLLIEPKKEKGSELDRQMSTERKLLAETEE